VQWETIEKGETIRRKERVVLFKIVEKKIVLLKVCIILNKMS
jgi:hypothetical protein